MPSAWDRIGVNWNDLTRIRLEPVINEIYRATQERDYWLRFAQGNPISLPSTTTANLNTQLRYIYSTFERWFKPLAGLSSSQLLLSGYYIEEDGNPTADPSQEFVDSLVFSTPYGKDSYNYMSGGNLSTLVNYDMSFLSTGLPPNQYQLNIDHIYKFYEILNLNLKSRMFRLLKSGSDYFSDSQRQNLFVDMFRTEVGTDDPQNASTAVNTINNNQNETDATSVNFRMNGRVSFSRANETDELYNGFFRRYQISLDNYSIQNFNLSCFFRIWEDKDAGFSASYTPNVGNYIQGNNFRTLTVTNQGNSSVVVYDPLPVILTSSISGSSNLDSVNVYAVPQIFIDLNNQELINYYTEPTP